MCITGKPHVRELVNFRSVEVTLLLQSALQPLWVLACSIIVEYSQQEGFLRV